MASSSSATAAGQDPSAAIEIDDGFEYDPSYSFAPKTEAKQEDDYTYQNGLEEDEDQLKQEDYWTIITTFFEEKGLVRQQLESFNEFVENTMQEIVDENSRLMLDQHQQYSGQEDGNAESVSACYKQGCIRTKKG